MGGGVWRTFVAHQAFLQSMLWIYSQVAFTQSTTICCSQFFDFSVFDFLNESREKFPLPRG